MDEAANQQATAISTARAIMAELPAIGGGWRHEVYDARMLALTVLLEPTALTIAEIKDALGIPRASTSDLVTEAAKQGLVERHTSRRDARLTVVALTAKAIRLRRLRRGSGGRL